MANDTPQKDTVYVDVDDEITAIIDKVRASKGRIVALVLPKRATVLQSIVNMKLLKRSAEQASKQIVLITTEAGLMPLAGAVALPVAATLQSKPEVPAAPKAGATGAEEEESLSLDDEPEPEFTAENAGDKPVGELAGAAAAGAATGFVVTSGVETENPIPDAAKTASGSDAAKPKGKPDKKLKVPNFNKFRVRLALIILGVLLLIGGLVAALVILPSATVAISTNSEDINSSIGLTLDTNAEAFDINTSNLPATVATQEKTYTKQVDATGEENNGDLATGKVTFIAQKCAPDLGTPDSVPSGTGISSGSKTYITQETASFSFDKFVSGSCAQYKASNVDITAQKGGTEYNVNNASFTVNGRSEISGTGSADGGTDDIITIVSQADIDNASGKINTNDAAVKATLIQDLQQDNLYAVSATFTASKPKVSSSSKAGDEASSVTVTSVITYSMFGTDRKDLLALVTEDVGQQVDLDKQAIADDGIDNATFTVEDQTKTVARLNMENTATVGAKIDEANIKQLVAGKKSGEAKDLINQLPGVTDVQIKLGPFWVSSIPSNQDKITVEVDKQASGN